ncbi:hypothetical protein GOC55_13075 [Sinorhizobium medicae]|nr:hypothetical protein [Sinorhizobium medicae]
MTDAKTFETAISEMRLFVFACPEIIGSHQYRLDGGLMAVEGYRYILDKHLALPWASYKHRLPSRFHNTDAVVEARQDARVALWNLFREFERLEAEEKRAGEPLFLGLSDFGKNWDRIVRHLRPLDDEFIGRHTATTNEFFHGLTENPYHIPIED